MQVVIALCFLSFSFNVFSWGSVPDFGQFSSEVIVNSPVSLLENTEYSVDEIYNRQMEELQFQNLEFSTSSWRKKRLQKVLNKGRQFEDYDEKNNLILGKFAAIKGKVSVFRGGGRIKSKKNGLLKQGDLVETKDNGHAWISLVDGTIIRMSPNSIYSLESFEVSPKNIIFFHRINNGNVIFASRREESSGPSSVFESDRIFYPFFDFHEFADFLDFSKRDNYTSRTFHNEKYRMLNFLKANNRGILDSKKINHIINSPYLIIDFKQADLEFVVDWQGNDHIKVSRIDEGAIFYKKNIERLEKFDFSKKKVWYSIGLSGVVEIVDSNLYWFGDFSVSDIPSIEIISEIFISKNAGLFFSSNSQMKFWRRYMISDVNLKNRKKFLIEYMNKQGASFLGERESFLKKNGIKNIDKMNRYSDYYEYSNYFNRLFSEIKISFNGVSRENMLREVIMFNNKMSMYFNKFEDHFK